MDQASNSEKMFKEAEAFIRKSSRHKVPGSEDIHTLICIISRSTEYIRDRIYAVSLLKEHIGIDTPYKMSDEQCEGMERILRPMILNVANTAKGY